MSEFPLRPQVLRTVESVRGCDPPTTTYTPEDPAVFNGMDMYPPSTDCLRGQPWSEECFKSWSWDLTTCVDMMPFKIMGMRVTGVFTAVSSLARSIGIDVGSRYEMVFWGCNYTFRTVGSEHDLVEVAAATGFSETGSYDWTRASRTSATNGGGGNNRFATMEFSPEGGVEWDTLWDARERFSGSFQSKYGFATFQMVPADPTMARMDNAHN
jgi:hypothetical protein